VATCQKINSNCSGGISHQSTEIRSCSSQNISNSSCEYVYSDWSNCFPNNTQTRILLSSSLNCSILPILVQTCTHIPNCGEANWNFEYIGECNSSGKREIVWNKIGECFGGLEKNSNEIVFCNYTPPNQIINCSSFNYSSWGECSSEGIRSRTVVSSLPLGCFGGNPILRENCKTEEKVNVSNFEISSKDIKKQGFLKKFLCRLRHPFNIFNYNSCLIKINLTFINW